MKYLDDYRDHGMFDHLNSTSKFMALMSDRHENTLDFYLTGISMLDSWYGDNAYRQYDAWFDVLDQLLNKAENHFKGRFGEE
jgi:hypothetical protein